MASSVLSGDQLNFTRIVIACVDEIKVVLADILSCEIKPGDLPKAIRSCSNLITGMFKLRTEQMNICCPSPSGAPDYYKFDVTLLYALIRNLCPQLKPTQGWGKAPSIKDMQIGDDIERLREIRNTMHAHVNSSKVDDATFSSHWQNLPRITIRGNANVVCGNNTSFEAELDMCSSSNNWPVTWEKIIGNKTEQININGDKYKGSSTMRLIIPRVLKEDQGEYRAFVDRENNGTHIKIPSNSILLTVLGEKPNLEKLSLSKEQNDIKIICKFRVDEQTPNADQILWEKNGQSLQNCLRMHVDHSKTDSTLTISRATGDDFGEYSCNVSNAVGTSKECIVLGISVVTAIKELSVPFGDSALIQAKIVSCPPVENISWQKSTSGESHAEKFQTINVNLSKYSGTTLDSTNPKLVIRQTTFQDRVFYQLLVSNGIGRCVSSSTFLDVKGSPPNVFTGHETNFQKQSVKLKCN
ncbi:muscle M-line assembly protein unc-89-like, partial [Saccostrea cucullata]|uniref:muscle M-line assembly protein unc-89-like n=1 Tax=Saccostrea cuccullata TaxID=36930 RepID=UPI002ED43EA2